MKHILRHESVLFLLCVLVIGYLTTQTDKFFTVANLLNQGRLMTEVGIVAVIMTFVICTGGIDLSVGSIVGLSAILGGIFWQKLGMPIPVAMTLAVLVGAFAGFFNGFVIVKFGLPPLITTLATLALYRGLAEGISKARSTRGFPESFYILGQGEIAGVPTQLWIFGIISIIAAVILGLTSWGRTVYAIGANEVAAKFSCLPTDRAKLLIYSASGAAAGLAGVIFVSRVTTTRSDMGSALELDAITAVVLGGTSIFGGKGTVVGTLLGLILIQALKNGLSLSGVKGDGTTVLIGVVLIGALLISNLVGRRG